MVSTAREKLHTARRLRLTVRGRQRAKKPAIPWGPQSEQVDGFGEKPVDV
jgi:hypothetical protein